MNAKFLKMDIAGYPIFNTTSRTLCEILTGKLRDSQQCVLLFANSNFVVNCRDYIAWLCSDPVLIINDGIAMDIAARIVHGEKFKENLNGTDFCPAFLGALKSPHKIFLVGGRPGVAEQAAEVIRKKYGHDVVGCADGFEQIRSESLDTQINSSGAEIVLVALGNPRQEGWISRHCSLLDAKLIIGVGALFDFLSGNIQRAPLWVRHMRCEWLYRLSLEPKRLAKRYTVDIVYFIYLGIKYRGKKADYVNQLR